AWCAARLAVRLARRSYVVYQSYSSYPFARPRWLLDVEQVQGERRDEIESRESRRDEAVRSAEGLPHFSKRGPVETDVAAARRAVLFQPGTPTPPSTGGENPQGLARKRSLSRGGAAGDCRRPGVPG